MNKEIKKELISFVIALILFIAIMVAYTMFVKESEINYTLVLVTVVALSVPTVLKFIKSKEDGDE